MVEIIRKNRNLLLVIIDILIIIAGYIASMIFLSIKVQPVSFIKQVGVCIVIYEIFLNVFHMYQNMLHYEVGKDYAKYIISAILSVGTITVIAKILGLEYLTIKMNLLSGILIAGVFVMYRLAGRSILSRKASAKYGNQEKTKVKPINNRCRNGCKRNNNNNKKLNER